jgi:hypothetical protein
MADNYGWGNAAADIIGAVLKRNYDRSQQANMYGDIANQLNTINNTDFGAQTNLIDQASSDNPNSNYTGKNIKNKAVAGLLPNADFLGQQATSDNLGKGLFTGGQSQTQNAAQYIPGSSSTSPVTPQATQQYSFTNPLAESNPNNQYSKANNPATVQNTQPLTTAQAKSQLYAHIPLAAKELASKGYDPKVFMPMLQQATQDKLGEYQYQYNQNQAANLMQNFNAETNPMRRAMLAAQMKQYGLEIDPKMISALSPEYKMEVVDQGPQKSLVLYNPKTGEVASGGTLGVGVSPNTQYTQEQENNRWVTPSANAQLGANARIQAAGISASARGNNSKPTGKTSTGLNYNQYEKANTRYGEILQDLWNSSTPQERTMKANSYTDELNTLGQLLDKNVNNDVNYIMGGG